MRGINRGLFLKWQSEKYKFKALVKVKWREKENGQWKRNCSR